MYKLYYSPGACSMAVHAILEECGATYTLENRSTKEGKNKTPDFLKISPLGMVPVLEENGHIMREGGAMIVYLCDTHKSPLLPPSGTARADALEWLMFCNATLHPAYGRVFKLMGATLEPKEAKDSLIKTYVASINTCWEVIEKQLEGRSYLCGETITAGDILLSVIGNWGIPGVVIGPKAKAVFARVSQRPAFQEALKSEQVDYKAAA